MNNNNKVLGIYRFTEKDDMNKTCITYCYVLKDSNDKVTYHFTEDETKVKRIIKQYATENGYNKSNKYKIITDNPNRFNLNCNDIDDVFDRIKDANPKLDIDVRKFAKAKNRFNKKGEEKEKVNLIAKARNFIRKGKAFVRNKRYPAANFFSKLKDNKKFKRVACSALLMGLCAIGAITAFRASKNNSPTNTGSKIAIVDDPDLDNDIDEEQIKEGAADLVDETTVRAQAKANAETAAKASASTSTNRTTNRASSSSNISTAVTTTPGSINTSVPAMEDPNATLNTNNNNNSNNTNPSQDTNNDNYQNVTEEEIPSNSENGNTSDDDYTEIIDVPAKGEEDTNTPSQDEDTNKEDETINKDNVIFDDQFIGNEDAIDDDVSYDNVYEYEEETPSLPDPNETATSGNGDYVTSEEELTESAENINNNTNITTGSTTPLPDPNETATAGNGDYVTSEEEIDVVPVEQGTSLTDTELNNERMVTKAVEAMANGEDVNLVYNYEDGTMNIEQNSQSLETNSLTK